MKKISIAFFAGAVMLASSCTKKLDINDNPNQSTSATPQVMLPQAVAATASVLNAYNSYGAQVGGYMANAGGYGGFGSNVTYNWSSSDYSGLWANTYDNLNDYQVTINLAEAGGSELGYFNAAARIMKAIGFQLLVDTYNDVPYTDALQGVTNLTPSYNTGTDIYKMLGEELDKAIALINETAANGGEIKALGSSDPLFNGDMNKWKQLANTIKLRLMVRSAGKVQFSNTSFDDAGFLSTDALINPGYTRDNGKQNPEWNSWAYTYTGSTTNRAWMPTDWMWSFYYMKADDPRGYAVYLAFPNTVSNTLGYESSNVASSPAGSAWFSHVNKDAVADAASSGNSIGVLKGPNAGFPVITAAESYFLQAEAALTGLIAGGDVEALFNDGILASYKYLYSTPNGGVSSDAAWNNPEADYDYYITENAGNKLVDFSATTTPAEQLEAIITQKYIAMNMVNSQEGYFEYLRTGYPTIVNGSHDGLETFASLQSVSTRADKLPARILYPNSENSYNPNNVPKGIDPFTSKIFWSK